MLGELRDMIRTNKGTLTHVMALCLAVATGCGGSGDDQSGSQQVSQPSSSTQPGMPGTKPSGAGGGDVAIALFADESSEERFRALCSDCKFTLLTIELGAPGVRLEEDERSGRR